MRKMDVFIRKSKGRKCFAVFEHQKGNIADILFVKSEIIWGLEARVNNCFSHLAALNFIHLR